MSNYPFSLDDDSTIIRVDDNITQLGGLSIDQCRAAIFAIESEIGIGGSGAVGSIAARIGVSIDPNGFLLPSAILQAISSTQFSNAQIAPNAAIQESKIALSYSTQTLYNMIQTLSGQLSALNQFAQTTQLDFLKHISGVAPLSGGESGRHVVSHIDINLAPTDPRDPNFTWPGGHAPTDRNGVLRGSNLALFLYNINQDLVNHELSDGNVHTGNIPNQYGHVGAAVSLDPTNFEVIPKTIVNVQEFANFVDRTSFIGLTVHQQDEHGNNIPRTCRGTLLNSTNDGYVGSAQEIVPFTLCKTFLHDNGSGGNSGGPVDNTLYGDDVIQFIPTPDPTYNFDSAFSQVKPGQIITVNYGSVQAQYIVESARASYDGSVPPNRTYYVRINGRNIMDSYTAVARIDAPVATNSTSGVLALAQTNNTFASLPSVTVSDPRAASALGVDFDASGLGPTCCNLYLAIYPTGNPVDHILQLPAIDVTGNLGATPGVYTIDTVIAATNDAFAAPGFNYRFIAYKHEGRFGIAMTDAIKGAGFSIINGTVSTGGALGVGSFTNNVIGDVVSGPDPLGFGKQNANIASPPYLSSFGTIQQAQFPTLVFLPLVNKNYYANGQAKSSLNTIAPSDGYFDQNGDGYWVGSIISKTVTPGITVRATYQINQDLSKYGLTPGKTILIQPSIPFSSSLYNDTDYGRFIIDNVSYTTCSNVITTTTIEVYNCIYGIGTPVSVSSTGINVAIYYSENSIGFDALNLVNAADGGNSYKRYFEFFVDSNGHTFNTERARLNQTIGDVNLTQFNIVGVGPKLRGYTNNIDNLTNTSSSILLNLTAWDPATGIFTGNLCNTVSTNLGPSVTGKKGEVVRFYDETGIDYIDLVVNLSNYNSLTTPVVFNPTVPAQLNIDLFPSLQLDSQVFYLGAAQLNGATQQVSFVQDGRQFGSVTENELSTSARKFIAAVPANINQNGVIRGFDLVSSTNIQATFRGGSALVNGAVQNVNNFAVSIPLVQNYNGGTPVYGVLWAICVNDEAEIVIVPITSPSASEVLLKLYDPATTAIYPANSMLFSTLVTQRKDLTPLYIFFQNNGTGTVKDARKLNRDNDANIDLVLSADPNTGHFTQFATVDFWLNFNSAHNTIVKVKGMTTISTSSVMLYSQPVNFIGESGGGFNLPGSGGISLSSTVTFDGMSFTFPTGGTGNLTFQTGSVVTFNNCTFNCGVGTLLIQSGSTVQFNNCIMNFNGVSALGPIVSGGAIFNDCIVTLATTAQFTLNAGSNCVFNQCTVTVPGRTGFNVKGNVLFDGCTVTNSYDATSDGTWAASNLVNCVGDGYGVIAGNFSNQTIQNISISDSKFITTTVNHYPVVSFYCVNTSSTGPGFGSTFVENVLIENNKFISTTGVEDIRAVIAIMSGDTNGSGSESPKLVNTSISDNYCDKNQMIFLGATTSAGHVNPSTAFAMSNVHVDHNICGSIMYLNQNDFPRNTVNLNQITRDKDETLIISGNTCHLIGTAYQDGKHRNGFEAGTSVNFWMGSASVKNNTANWMMLDSNYNLFSSGGGLPRTTLTVSNNKLFAYDTAFLTQFIVGTVQNTAMFLQSYQLSGLARIIVDGNTFEFSDHVADDITTTTNYFYDVCIDYSQDAVITNNFFDSCLTSANTGIFINANKDGTITGNRFYRHGQNIVAYIQGVNTPTLIVTDNFFDLPTVAGGTTPASYQLIAGAGDRSILTRNKNQTVYVTVPLVDMSTQPKQSYLPPSGTLTNVYDTVLSTLSGSNPTTAAQVTPQYSLSQTTINGAVVNTCCIDKYIPDGASLLSAAQGYTLVDPSNDVSSSGSQVQLTIATTNSPVVDFTNPAPSGTFAGTVLDAGGYYYHNTPNSTAIWYQGFNISTSANSYASTVNTINNANLTALKANSFYNYVNLTSPQPKGPISMFVVTSFDISLSGSPSPPYPAGASPLLVMSPVILQCRW